MNAVNHFANVRSTCAYAPPSNFSINSSITCPAPGKFCDRSMRKIDSAKFCSVRASPQRHASKSL